MPDDWSYTTSHHGTFLTIRAPDGRTCFLQGDDASSLLTDLESCTTSEQESILLSAYDSVCTHDPRE